MKTVNLRARQLPKVKTALAYQQTVCMKHIPIRPVMRFAPLPIVGEFSELEIRSLEKEED